MSEQPQGDHSVYDAECASRQVLEHATGRWGALTLTALTDEPLRYAALRRSIGGISDRMLSQTLRRLEHDGLILRTEHPTEALRVDYELTELGRPIAESLREVIRTVYRQLPGIVAHQLHHGATVRP